MAVEKRLTLRELNELLSLKVWKKYFTVYSRFSEALKKLKKLEAKLYNYKQSSNDFIVKLCVRNHHFDWKNYWRQKKKKIHVH